MEVDFWGIVWNLIERFGMPAGIAAVLLTILWKFGSRIISAHEKFLDGMVAKAHRDSESIAEINTNQALAADRIDEVKKSVRRGDGCHYRPRET